MHVARTSLVCLILATLAAPALGAASATPEYAFATVRDVQGSGWATLYRLNTRTGALCIFLTDDTPDRGLREVGCFRGDQASDATPVDRYAIEAIADEDGTAHSLAFRLDRVTGEICPFLFARNPGGGAIGFDCLGAKAGSKPSAFIATDPPKAPAE